MSTAPRGTTTLTLGTASFKILAGRTATRKVKVSQQGAQLIAAAAKLKATARTSARDARNGAPVVKSAPVTLKPPKAARLIARR